MWNLLTTSKKHVSCTSKVTFSLKKQIHMLLYCKVGNDMFVHTKMRCARIYRAHLCVYANPMYTK